jgi:hypothetical protein
LRQAAAKVTVADLLERLENEHRLQKWSAAEAGGAPLRIEI